MCQSAKRSGHVINKETNGSFPRDLIGSFDVSLLIKVKK